MCSVCSSTWPDNPAPGWPRVGLPHILKTRPTPPPDTRQRSHQPGAIQVPSPSGGGKLGHLRPQWFAYQTPSQAAVIAGSLIQFASAGEVGEREAPACSQTDLNETRHLRHKPPIEHRRPGERPSPGIGTGLSPAPCSVPVIPVVPGTSSRSGRARPECPVRRADRRSRWPHCSPADQGVRASRRGRGRSRIW